MVYLGAGLCSRTQNNHEKTHPAADLRHSGAI